MFISTVNFFLSFIFMMCLLIVCGAVPLALTVKNSTASPDPQRNCTQILEPINQNEILGMLFSGKWILQEAYSSDPIDQEAMAQGNSSWAEFTEEPNGTIYLQMTHMLNDTNMNGTIRCVYHHFRNITLWNNTLYLDLPQYNASATFQFLKACNECLVMTAQATVPGYPALDYLLAYGLHREIDDYYLIPTRKQAACKNLMPPPPFKYKGADFCPNDEVAHKTPKMVLKGILFPPWSLFTNPMDLS